MTITPEKTWEVVHTRISGDVGSVDTENKHLMFALKQALKVGTNPWVTKLSCGKNGGGSLVAGPTAKTVADITLSGTDPVSVECTTHGFATGDRVKFASIVGTTELNGNTYDVTVTDTSNFTLDDTDSSDFTTYTSGGDISYQDDVDRWLSVDDLVWSDSDHAWIVLEQSGIGTGGKFQLLIELDDGASSTEFISVYVSPGGRFMDGTVSDRPTADDEVEIINTGNWGGTTTEYSVRGVFVCRSDDGECTRVYTTYDADFLGFWMLDTADDPISGWTDPWIVTIQSLAGSPTEAQLFDSANIFADTRMTGTEDKLFATTLVVGTTLLTQTDAGSSRTHDDSWVATRIGLDRDDTTYNGIVGRIYDLWRVSTKLQKGQYLESGNAWEMVAVGTRYAQPWDGSTVVIW